MTVRLSRGIRNISHLYMLKMENCIRGQLRFILHCDAAQELLMWQSRTPDFIAVFGKRELTGTAPTMHLGTNALFVTASAEFAPGLPVMLKLISCPKLHTCAYALYVCRTNLRNLWFFLHLRQRGLLNPHGRTNSYRPVTGCLHDDTLPTYTKHCNGSKHAALHRAVALFTSVGRCLGKGIWS